MTNNKYGLALHTTSPQLGLAISNFAGDTRSQTWDLGRDLSTYLQQHLAEFIKPQTWVDLEFIAVAKGPGSFTSTRIGIVTARTLAQQLDIPLLAISTLAAMGWFQVVKDSEQFEQLTSPPTLALQMPAQRNQLFTAVYQVSFQEKRQEAGGRRQEGRGFGLFFPFLGGGSLEARVLTQVLPDSVMTPETWQQSLESLQMPYQLVDVPRDLGTNAASVLDLAYGLWQQGKRPHWSEALPFYGQHPV
ncbi:MAG: tRNA (adenosine(37)-N6)-threonylcarbamoyltransferase complex dimerization subunit type 1 TsaB [Symploca sp. SIO1A3]|nr:tRNA (adenosine(37)-N6)-threonylcarbamoyltransferase complex dimerization subunit type 1 TsaB [Symploca sp. SIO1A3]